MANLLKGWRAYYVTHLHVGWERNNASILGNFHGSYDTAPRERNARLTKNHLQLTKEEEVLLDESR